MVHPYVMSWMDVNYGEQDASVNPEDLLYDYRILAEGDSWFSLAGIPCSNLLFPMEFPADTVIVNCAKPGDTIRNMAQISSSSDLRHAMDRRFGSPWDAILLSGGGNDLIDDVDDILVPHRASENPADYCDEQRLQITLESIELGYRRIAELRDRPGSSCRGKPIIPHVYDRVTPRNAPAKFFGVPLMGPWLYSALTEADIPPQHWNAVSDYLLGRLADTIKGLAKGPGRIRQFVVVNTQGTLTRADPKPAVDSHDWLNEIHPDAEGYKKLARKIGKKVWRLMTEHAQAA